MFKTNAKLLIGAAIIFAGIGAAAAKIGTAPNQYDGYIPIEGKWVYGVAAGQNFIYQNGLTAVGTNQATALQLGVGYYLMEVDTAGSGGATGVALPACIAGTQIVLVDNTAYTIDVYPQINNNTALSPAAQDTINNSTSTTITTYTNKVFTCGKTGVWSAK